MLIPYSADSEITVPHPMSNGKALLSLLGTFWNRYYKDIVVAEYLATGGFWLNSVEYTRVLQTVLSSNILNIPEYQTTAYAIKVFDTRKMYPVYNLDRTIAHYEYVCQEDMPYLTSSLLEPEVILKKGVHYDINDNVVKFYVDLFNDPAIRQNFYTTGGSFILMWAVDTVIQEAFIYERFGTFLYDRLTDSAASKLVYTAMQYFFTNQKNVDNIEFVLNMLVGMPYNKYADNTVLAVTDTEIITSQQTYARYADAEVVVTVGAVVPQYTLLTRVIRVEDYLSDPDWFSGCPFPYKVVDSLIVRLDSVYVPEVFLDGSLPLNGAHTLVGKEPFFLPNPDTLYNPMRLDGSVQLKGYYAPEELDLKNSLDTSVEYIYYNLMDTVLKYNLFHIRYDIYDSIPYKSLDLLYAAIKAGMPAHINYAAQQIVHGANTDTTAYALKDAGCTVKGFYSVHDFLFEVDPVPLDGAVLLNGTYLLNGVASGQTPVSLSDSFTDVEHSIVAGNSMAAYAMADSNTDFVYINGFANLLDGGVQLTLDGDSIYALDPPS